MAYLLLLGMGLCATSSYAVIGKALVIQPSGSRRGLCVSLIANMLERAGRLVNIDALSSFSYWTLVAREVQYWTINKGVPLSLEAAYVCVAVCVGFSSLFGLFISFSWIGLLAALFMSMVALVLWASSASKQRAQVLAGQMPDVFRSLASALGSGRTLSQAIGYVGSSGSGLLQKEFSRMSLKIACGVPANEALSELPSRVKAPGIDLMVIALDVSARTGAPLQVLFTRLARLVERRAELERELTTKTAQVRLSARMVTALPACLVCLLALLSPDFRAGVVSPVGSRCIAAAIVLDALALFIIRRLMRGVM